MSDFNNSRVQVRIALTLTYFWLVHQSKCITAFNFYFLLKVFSYFGEFLFHFGSRGSGAGQFNGPTGVSVLRDGSIVVCDCLNNRVQLFTSDGIFLSAFGSEGRGEGEFWRPMGVAVDGENRIVVVDQGRAALKF